LYWQDVKQYSLYRQGWLLMTVTKGCLETCDHSPILPSIQNKKYHRRFSFAFWRYYVADDWANMDISAMITWDDFLSVEQGKAH
jgi:hypothetical protein